MKLFQKTGEDIGIMDLVHSVDQHLLIALSHLDDAQALTGEPGFGERIGPAKAVILAELDRRHLVEVSP